MELSEKIEKSKCCIFECGGSCALDGNPPYDCELCGSFVPINEGKEAEQ